MQHARAEDKLQTPLLCYFHLCMGRRKSHCSKVSLILNYLVFINSTWHVQVFEILLDLLTLYTIFFFLDWD